MSSINLLFATEYSINDKIKIMIPKVGEVIDQEDDYFGIVSMLTSSPYDMMVQLDDMGIDFTQMSDYELFLLVFFGIREMDTSLIFGDLDLSKFEPAENEENGNIVLIDTENDIVIDKSIYHQIAATLRKIHHLEKNNRKPGNEEAKKFLLERARKKLKRNSRKTDSQLESLIISVVNTEQFKYNFESVRNMTIYQFNESVRQIIHKIDYEHLMGGIYAGTIDSKNISNDNLNWMSHK